MCDDKQTGAVRCSVCGSSSVTGFLTVDDLPLLIFPVDEAVKDDIVSKTITSFECRECRHVFTTPLPAEDVDLIYGKYYRYYPYDNLETMNSVYRLPFESFFDRVHARHRGGAKPRRLLEVGCSSGEHLKCFERYGLQCQGIDPSPLNVDRSGKIISGMYETHEFPERYDVIVSRFNLEHLNDIRTFFEKASADLSDRGYLFIQVPNIPQFSESLIPLFLAHEHVQYFNPYSLSLAGSKHGFAAIDAEYRNSQSILIALKKSPTTETAEAVSGPDIPRLPPSFYSRYAQQRSRIAQDVQTLLNERSEMHFYGAGLALSWILYDLRYRDRETRAVVIDDNALLHGKFLPGSSCRVSPFDAGMLGAGSTVLCTLNPTYHAAVVQRLADAGFEGEVFAVDRQGLHKLVPT